MKTWILVADGSKARIFQYLGPKKLPEVIDNGEFNHINQPTRDIAQEKRGRVFHSADGTRSAMERPSDPHEYEKTRFHHQLANFLEQQLKQQQFDRLIVIAPPKSLGDFRKFLCRQVLATISGEINKDLTNIDQQALLQHLQTVINIDS